MGEVPVPARRRYGAQTARAVVNFPGAPAGMTLGDHPALVLSLLRIKQAAARANAETGFLDTDRAARIERACEDIASWRDFRREFPVHILHGGGGTSANMNTNEVVAHVANSLNASRYDRDQRVDALEHVNCNQSTNDVYPSACRASLLRPSIALIEGVERGRRQLGTLRNDYRSVPRLARTCLRDAVGSDYGVYFGAQETAWARARQRFEAAHKQLEELSVGGGITGERTATPDAYRSAILPHLRELIGLDSIRLTPDFADAAQHTDGMLDVAHAADTFARLLMKQCQDLRILGSGPDGGFGEIVIPAVQPGSSAIPGKVNPVIPEFVMQCCMQTMAATSACAMATERGELDLNVWEGVVVYNLSLAFALMRHAVQALSERCWREVSIPEALNSDRARVPTALGVQNARSLLGGALPKRTDPPAP